MYGVLCGNMARGADTEAVEKEEIRYITDHPEIDGIEDLDGDVEHLDIGIDNLDDLSRGDVVNYVGDGDPDGGFVVTGRHESSGGTTDETDVIEMKEVNRYSDTLHSRPGSVAYLHSRGVFGELEVRTGWSAFRTRLAGSVREKHDAIRLRRGGFDG